MLMNENSELRSLLRLSKNFSKNIINKSIKNNIVPINNDGGVKASGLTRGFIPSTFAVTLSHIKFSLFTKTAFLINSLTNIIFSIPINIVTLFHIKFSIFISSLIVIYIFIYTFFCSLFLILNYISSIIVACIVFISFIFIYFLVVPHIFIYILIQISNSSLINISFSSSFISFIYISFISFIIFTSFTGLFISDNTIITI